ncbi:HHL299Wp [Eremothecium sinecaudum]|uniref:HHL299Wp n=1 Tax=Eremothecium sinecaudum TaxID=45286 RepID=A0A109UYA6_9SACH|nr:HHL299Wp [Eremothecium sinecaudum]AMD22471.1 HHL299Wp [Eremothecium sinecaudum]
MTSDLMEVDSTPVPQLKAVDQVVVDKFIDLLRQVSRTTTTLDSRYVWKSLRELPGLRKELNQTVLSIIISLVYPDDSTFKVPLLKVVNKKMKTTVENAEAFSSKYPADFYQLTSTGTVDVSAEVNTFVHLLVQLHLMDTEQIPALENFNLQIVVPNVLQYYNNRTLDFINAKLWFYIARAHELLGNTRDNTVRVEMMLFLRTATLKYDNETKATLITLILREYLNAGEVETAADFVSKVEFPSDHDVSSSLEARYYFYLSKINAIQLDYSAANEYVMAAIKKAPNSPSSLGFLQQANKLHCVIQLLMGDIPELSFFRQVGMESTLTPYFHLSKAVKLGDLKMFTSTISKYKQQLVQDSNYQLCVRLRSNVIKTGIRIISLTYKKISLKDICLRLHLDSEQTVEYMVSRAIRDGVIEAKINHEEGYIETSELLNVYATKQPQNIFDERIRFVNQLHDECVMAMRYPGSRERKKNVKTEEEDKEPDGEGTELSDYGSDIEDLL